MDFPSIKDGPLSLTIQSWELIASTVGAVLVSIASFLVFILARNEATWQNRQQNWEEKSKFFQETAVKFENIASTERSERVEKEAQLDKLKEQIAELRDQKSEILKKNLLETDSAILKLKGDLSGEVERLKKEVEHKDRELNDLRATQTQSFRELETLRAEVLVRNRLIDELQGEIESLTAISDANNEIVIRLDKAAFDVRSVDRARKRVYSQLSNMTTDVIRTAEKAVLAHKNVERGRADQRIKAEMARRNQEEVADQDLRAMKLRSTIRDTKKES